jgi:hypothetical protein
MASLSRVHGSVAADQFQGRALTYVKLSGTGIGTGYGSIDSNFEKAIRAIEGFMYVTIIFTPAANVAVLAVENAPSDYTDATTAVNAAQSVTCTLAATVLTGTTWS